MQTATLTVAANVVQHTLLFFLRQVLVFMSFLTAGIGTENDTVFGQRTAAYLALSRP